MAPIISLSTSQILLHCLLTSYFTAEKSYWQSNCSLFWLICPFSNDCFKDFCLFFGILGSDFLFIYPAQHLVYFIFLKIGVYQLCKFISIIYSNIASQASSLSSCWSSCEASHAVLHSGHFSDFHWFSICSDSLSLSSAAAVLSGVCPPHVFLF